MNYLVTGGTGFVGAYAVKAIVEAGHRVTVFDLMLNREYLADVLGNSTADEVQMISGDVTDLPAVLRAMRSAEAQRVVHLAATLSVSSEANPLRTLKVNCEGTLNVFEAALALGVSKVVWASSVAVFGISGDREEFIENDAHHEPTGLYGAVKSFNESLGMHYKNQRGLDNIGLRFTVVYGYGKAFTKARGTGADFMTELLEKPAGGEPGVIRNGDDAPDFLYAEDVGRAIHLATEAPLCPHVGPHHLRQHRIDARRRGVGQTAIAGRRPAGGGRPHVRRHELRPLGHRSRHRLQPAIHPGGRLPGHHQQRAQEARPAAGLTCLWDSTLRIMPLTRCVVRVFQE